MERETRTIAQRAADLERKLFGRAGGGGQTISPSRPDYPDPNTLVTPQQYAALWAQCEAIVVGVTVDVLPKWIGSFALNPCNVTGSMVMGTPGCVTAEPYFGPVQHRLASANLPQRQEARAFCEKAVEGLFSYLDKWRAALAPQALNWYPAYAAPLPTYPAGIPNVPCPLSDLGRTASFMLAENMIDLELQKSLDFEWNKLYRDPQTRDDETIGRQVCKSIAAQVAKYMKGIGGSLVQGVTANSLTGPVGPMTPQGPVALPFNGRTAFTAGIVTVIETWRPEWGG